MAEAQSATLECLDAADRGLRVEFLKQSDRFAHRIYVVDGSQVDLQLESVEGTDNDPAPPSPPFAELHQQGETLFLTGATTLGHWSMSVEAIAGKITFDVACRSKGELNSLGSAYQSFASDHKVELEYAVLRTTQAGYLQISPSAFDSLTGPSTIQWRYTIARKA